MDDSVERFIREYLAKYGSTSALDQKFHEEFYTKFGGARHECFWGAQTVKKAMVTLKKMAKQGILEVRRCGLAGNWQPGFPKWVNGYSLSEEYTEVERK